MLHLPSKAGLSSRVLAVIRRVGAGYSNPSITVSTGIQLAGPDILAWGLIDCGGSADIESATVELDILKRSVVVHPGDLIAMVFVQNVSSAMTCFGTCGYTISE